VVTEGCICLRRHARPATRGIPSIESKVLLLTKDPKSLSYWSCVMDADEFDNISIKENGAVTRNQSGIKVTQPTFGSCVRRKNSSRMGRPSRGWEVT
jgi:hypothetical protein